jgi:hypothetical protein
MKMVVAPSLCSHPIVIASLYWDGKPLQLVQSVETEEVARRRKNCTAIGNTINGVRLVTFVVVEQAAAWFVATIYGLVARLGRAFASNELAMIMLMPILNMLVVGKKEHWSPSFSENERCSVIGISSFIRKTKTLVLIIELLAGT